MSGLYWNSFIKMRCNRYPVTNILSWDLRLSFNQEKIWTKQEREKERKYRGGKGSEGKGKEGKRKGEERRGEERGGRREGGRGREDRRGDKREDASSKERKRFSDATKKELPNKWLAQGLPDLIRGLIIRAATFRSKTI